MIIFAFPSGQLDYLTTLFWYCQLFFATFLKNFEIPLFCLDYDNESYNKMVCGLESEKEGGPRCYKCFELRLLKTALFAKEKGFDMFTTTLSVSPYKNHNVLNEIGANIEKMVGIEYLPANFKKNNGYLKSIENSKKFGLYRQNYCGCKYSKKKN